jgi:hypothetical protein
MLIASQTHTFPTITLDAQGGFTTPAAITITVTNIGTAATTDDLTVALSGADAGSFLLNGTTDTITIPSLAPNASEAFTVEVASTGLIAKTHNANITVSGGGIPALASFGVRVTVNPHQVHTPPQGGFRQNENYGGGLLLPPITLPTASTASVTQGTPGNSAANRLNIVQGGSGVARITFANLPTNATISGGIGSTSGVTVSAVSAPLGTSPQNVTINVSNNVPMGSAIAVLDVGGVSVTVYVNVTSPLPDIWLLLHLNSDVIQTLNGSIVMDTVPVVENGRALVPIRFVANGIGARVDWNEGTREVTLTLDGVSLTFGVDGQTTPALTAIGMEVPARIIDGRTMVPIRFVSEFFGAEVNWDEDARSIEITK